MTIFGFLSQNLKTMAVAVAFSMAWAGTPEDGTGPAGRDLALGRLAGFRRELYLSLGKRRDALFEACDALACRPERVGMLAELCLEPECRRGHGGVYDALNSGDVVIAASAGAGVAASADVGRRPDPAGLRCLELAAAGRGDLPGTAFLHCYARGKGNKQVIPGWPYSFVAALGPGRTSWTLPLDAIRIGPDNDPTEVTAAQLATWPPGWWKRGTGRTATRTSWPSSTPAPS